MPLPRTPIDRSPNRLPGDVSVRLNDERNRLDVADLDFREGRSIADGDVDAWLDRWVAGEAIELLPDVPKDNVVRR